jgi:hypothetical protein
LENNALKIEVLSLAKPDFDTIGRVIFVRFELMKFSIRQSVPEVVEVFSVYSVLLWNGKQNNIMLKFNKWEVFIGSACTILLQISGFCTNPTRYPLPE